MTDDDNPGLDVPRRKVLGAIGAVGASSAGAGLGTSAYFSDTESFTGNSLQAGELNLKLSGYPVATNSDAIEVSGGTRSSPAEVDGSASTAFFTLGDIKPGDLAIVCLGIEIVGNPAYLEINGSVISDENTVNEAEAPVDNDDQTTEELEKTGELGQKTNIQAFGPNQSVDESESLSTILEQLEDGASFSATGGDSTFAGGGEVAMDVAFDTPTGGGTDYVLSTGSDPECFDPNTYRIYFVLDVPTTVGNVIQSDSLDLDLTVEAVQCRHNDDPFADDD